MDIFLTVGAISFYGVLYWQYRDKKASGKPTWNDRDLYWYEYLGINVFVLIAIALPIVLDIYDKGHYIHIGSRVIYFLISLYSFYWLYFRITKGLSRPV